MGYSVRNSAATPVTTPENWIQKYREQQMQIVHDRSMMDLGNADESLVVVGPPRLSMPADSGFYVVGMALNFQYSEQSQVQPFKAIGSRRHIFSKTNMPVQGSIGRLMVLGPNLYRALYALTQDGVIADPDNKFAQGYRNEHAQWYTNLEEDIFRLPIGLGIIYSSPETMHAGGTNAIGAEFIEVCVLMNRNVSIQAGQATIMEQVSFVADRVVPWDTYKNVNMFAEENAD